MKCDEIAELLPAYQDGELTLEERRTVEAHLAECPECRRTMKDLGTVTLALGELPEITVSNDFAEAVLRRARATRTRPLFTLRRVVSYAAAAVVVIGLGLWIAGIPERGTPDQLADLPNLELLGDGEYLGLNDIGLGLSQDFELESLLVDEPGADQSGSAPTTERRVA